jgi:tRNA U34 5-methylaminomethyl-2-thiouridine-forming methyltransferase MnmC
LKREIITTSDGSKTIRIEDWNESYHSKHGALNEAIHVFINTGLEFFLDKNFNKKSVNILEIGFGTGLNAILTLNYAKTNNILVEYDGVEAYPVKQEEIDVLNYVDVIEGTNARDFDEMHNTDWNTPIEITSTFKLNKREHKFEDINDKDKFDLVYFDAFGARVQPELWEENIFKKMYEALKPNGVLVTYSAKGSVRRAMQSVGFLVERLPGPPGKREMLRAIKQ